MRKPPIVSFLACSLARLMRRSFLTPQKPIPAAVALAARYVMAPVFETARMYKNGSSKMWLERCFGVTTFELG